MPSSRVRLIDSFQGRSTHSPLCSGQQLVAIGYGLYRGDSLVTRSRGVELAGPLPLVEHLRAKVCFERKLDSDKTLVFGNEGDLLDFLKDHKTEEQKVCLTHIVLQL